MHRTLRSVAAAFLLVLLTAGAGLVAQQPQPRAPQTQAPPQTFNAGDSIPFDAAVRTATLPNGLKVFIRHNERPARRVSLRLAVKAGSMIEADDQQGLAHLIEHMAFNGSAHFKPGELVSTFESVGARLGPHVNAYTSFDETVYMLDLPSDKPDIVAKGLTALADFAGGLTLDPAEVDKERGVVIEEWRGGLGARLAHPRQAVPGAVLLSRATPSGCRSASRRSSAPRRPRGCARSTTRGTARSGWPSSPSATSIRRQIEQSIRGAFGPLADRAPAAPSPIAPCRLQQQLLVNVATDPEVTRSNVQLVRKRPREDEPARRRLPPRPGRAAHRPDDRRALHRAVAPARREVPRRRRRRTARSARTVDSFTFTAQRPGRQDSGRPVRAGRRGEARARVRLRASELDRAKKLDGGVHGARVQRARQDRERVVRAGVHQLLPRGRAAPGIAYEYRLVQQVLPTITAAEVSAFVRGRCSATTAACCWRSRRRRPASGADRSGAAGRAGGGRRRPVSRRGPTRR